MQPSLRPPGGLSIYIHVPFCVQKCRYCNFYSVVNNDAEIISRTIASTLDQLLYYYEQLGRPSVSTLYIGGGTPSSIGLSATEELVKGIFRVPELKKNVIEGFEFTVEMNPESVSSDLLGIYERAGVNRLSIGIQTFQERYYRLLGRVGSPDLAREALALLRRKWKGRLNLDLMTAFPGQREAEGLADLRELLSYEPDHVSLYTLSIEEDTPLGADAANGGVSLPGDRETEVWERQVDALRDSGFEYYEVSNFALTGCRSSHNTAYWLLKPYLGCGPAAASTLPGEKGPLRVENERSLERFNVKEGDASGRGESLEIIPPDAFLLEHLIVGLRLSEGVGRKHLQDIFDVDPVSLLEETLGKWATMVEISAQRLRLTARGRNFLDGFLKDAAIEIEKKGEPPRILWP